MKLIKLITVCLLFTTTIKCIAQTKKKTTTKKTTTKVVAKKGTSAPQNRPATPKQNKPANKSGNTTNSNTTKTTNTNKTNNTSNLIAKELGFGIGNHVKKGTKFLNAGIGFSNYGLPIHLSLERLQWQDISLGVFVNAQSYNALGGFNNDNHLIIHAGLKSNYYFNHILGVNDDQWYLAAGISAGYWRYFYEGNASTLGWTNKGSIYLASQVDLRYFFNKHWGILLEGNYGGMNAGIIGVTYKP
jgi:outer membrane immunogenic protein